MYPKVTIHYCAKCKWHNRAVWYLQEIIQTFGDPEKFVAEVSLCPVYDKPGLFQIVASKEDGDNTILYQRKMKKGSLPQTEEFYYDGFPDSKFLKVLIRNYFFPAENLGHVDRHTSQLVDGTENLRLNHRSPIQTDTSIQCQDCGTEWVPYKVHLFRLDDRFTGGLLQSKLYLLRDGVKKKIDC